MDRQIGRPAGPDRVDVEGVMRDRYDTVVVGAGVAGAVAARSLAPGRDVLLLERTNVAAEATGRAAGLVAPTLFYGDDPAVARYANQFFRDLDGTEQFEFTGRARVDLVTESEAEEARETAQHRREAGFPVEFLDIDTVVERYPRFETAGFVGAVEYRDTGWVDPYSYTAAVVSEATARGASVETGVGMTGLVTEDGRVAGVETTDGHVGADSVVVAAGWRTRRLLADTVELPVQAYRTQCLVLEPDEPLGDSFPLARIGSEHLYARPEHNGDLLVGGGRELLDEPEAARQDEDETFRRTVAARLPDLLSGFENSGIVDGWAGVDGATPDGFPIVDAPGAGPDGLVVATGFNGLGVMISPVVGPAVRQLLGGDRAPFTPAPFSLDRFADRSPSFELASTSEL